MSSISTYIRLWKDSKFMRSDVSLVFNEPFLLISKSELNKDQNSWSVLKIIQGSSIGCLVTSLNDKVYKNYIIKEWKPINKRDPFNDSNI